MPVKETIKFCRACRQQKCLDFQHAHGMKTTRPCHLCKRKFFGEQCFEAHLVLDNQGKQNPDQSICKTVQRCKLCFKLETGKDKIKRHKCGHSFCPRCHFYVDIASHRCYVLPPMKRKRKGQESKNKRVRLDEDSLMDSEPELSEDEDDEEEEVELTMDYYMVEGMSPKDFKSFQEWHTKQREDGVVFFFVFCLFIVLLHKNTAKKKKCTAQ